MKYLVSKPAECHYYPLKNGTFEASNDELAGLITKLLREHGCLVEQQEYDPDAAAEGQRT